MSISPWDLAFVATLYAFLVAVSTLALVELGRPSPRPSACLEPLDPEPSRSIPLRISTWIGRDSHNTIVLADAYASGRHALVRRDQEGRWWLEDLGSRNGSYVNGRRAESAQPLSSGDVVQIGRTRFHLRT